MTPSRDQIAAALCWSLADRGPRVQEWPEDERDLHRNCPPEWSNDVRAEAVRMLRMQKAADAVLALLQPHTITTAEELYELGSGSVIRDRFGRVLERFDGWWGETGDAREFADRDAFLPATVVWSPEEAGQ